MLEPAHIVGISKTRYVLATPRCLEWRHALQRSEHEHDRIRIRRTRVAGLVVVIAAIAASSATSCRRPRLRGPHHPSTSFAVSTVVRSAKRCPARCGRHTARPRSSKEDSRRSTPARTSTRLRSPSVAKVMTAYLVLRDHPLRLGQDGPTITLTDADVADTDRRRGRSRSCPSPIAAGVPRSARRCCSVGRSRWTVRTRKLPGRRPPPTRLLTCRRDAVDVGPAAAAPWLSEHGADDGLCQVAGPEPWHCGLRPTPSNRGCLRHLPPPRPGCGSLEGYRCQRDQRRRRAP